MNYKIAIVVSEFNAEITEQLQQGCIEKLLTHKINKENIRTIKVPGAVEIPLAAQLLAKSKQYHAIIGLGVVIRGDTDHYDYVCQQVSYGCQRVMLSHDIPVIFGVLTADNLEQCQQRAGGNEGHKGKDAADTAMAMISVIQQISLCGDKA